MIDSEELREFQANFESTRVAKQGQHKGWEKLRREFVRRFPPSRLPLLSLDDYVQGKRSKDSFCYWVERETNEIGHIRGATAKKFGVYFDKKAKQFRFPRPYTSAEQGPGPATWQASDGNYFGTSSGRLYESSAWSRRYSTKEPSNGSLKIMASHAAFEFYIFPSCWHRAILKARAMTDFSKRADQDGDSMEAHRPVFATTHWSVVLTAGGADTTRAQQALSRLCNTYWYPLYAYVRKRGFNPQDAEDLTQEFFARLLRKKSLAHLSREGGRFRSFLLKSMNHLLTDEWRRGHVQKRGGAGKIVSLDAESAESRYSVEPVDRHTPETLYDRASALVLLDTVFHRLRDEYAQAERCRNSSGH